MWMSVEIPKTSRLRIRLDYPVGHAAGERCPAIRYKQPVTRTYRQVFHAHHLANGQPTFDRLNFQIIKRVSSWLPVLEPLNVQLHLIHLDIGYLKLARLRYPQPMANHQKDQAVISFRMARKAFIFARLEKLVHLGWSEIRSTAFVTRIKFLSFWHNNRVYHFVACYKR